MNTFQTLSNRAANCLGLAAACWFTTDRTGTAETCTDPRYFPGHRVIENQPSARIWLYREANTKIRESVAFYTADGPSVGLPYPMDAWRTVGFAMRPARAGVDYVPTQGTAVFPEGERSVSIEVPLIDNGLLDGFRDFLVVVSGPDPRRWRSELVRILDNEVHSAVDPLFHPDRRVRYAITQDPMDPMVMPDGRLLLADMTMLRTNGAVDIGFATNVFVAFTGARVRPLRALSDGRIFAVVEGPGESPARLVRLLPSGVLETMFTRPWFTRLIAIQPDGGILASDQNSSIRRFNPDGSDGSSPAYPISNFDRVVTELPDGRVLIFRYGPQRLSRLSADGALDPSFAAIVFGKDTGFGQVAVQPDGKVVVNATSSFGFKRFHPDGLPDDGFAPQHLCILDFLLTREGKFVVTDGKSLIRLNEDGTHDLTYRLPAPGFSADISLGSTKKQLPDGSLLIAPSSPLDFHNTLARWNADGSFDRIMTSDISAGFICGRGFLNLIVDRGQTILASRSIDRVDGISSPGLWRLLPKPPDRDFRVIRSTETSRTDRGARLQVVRTGSTTFAASVSFRTIDDTAIAGLDYVPQRGTLEFAPLEVTKELVVPLLHRNESSEPVYFNLELAGPSEGYSVIPVTPVVILPQLRIGIESVGAGDGSVELRLDGTLPGALYYIWTSDDFGERNIPAQVTALSPITRVTVKMPRRQARYFWATRQ